MDGGGAARSAPSCFCNTSRRKVAISAFFTASSARERARHAMTTAAMVGTAVQQSPKPKTASSMREV